VTQSYTGKSFYFPDYEFGSPGPSYETVLLFVAIPCRLGSLRSQVLALLDTGAQWCVVPPELAEALTEDLEVFDHEQRVSTRFGLLTGRLARILITFYADEGQTLEVSSTCFLPGTWPGPPVIGWKGCLERARFALDPTPSENAFYFAEI
jgi:hypothetical protein